MNRAARRARIFLTPADYRACEQLLIEAMDQVAIRLLAYVIMPNHFHLVLWPIGDEDLSCFMRWFTGTHAQRWHRAHGSVGTGAVYQGRFRAIPVQDDAHLLNVCRYVEQNPMRAHLVRKATQWRWSSAWNGLVVDPRPTLWEWPVPRPPEWARIVDEDLDGIEEEVRQRIQLGVPYGFDPWVTSTAEKLGLLPRLSKRGRRVALVDQSLTSASSQGIIATPR